MCPSCDLKTVMWPLDDFRLQSCIVSRRNSTLGSPGSCTELSHVQGMEASPKRVEVEHGTSKKTAIPLWTFQAPIGMFRHASWFIFLWGGGIKDGQTVVVQRAAYKMLYTMALSVLGPNTRLLSYQLHLFTCGSKAQPKATNSKDNQKLGICSKKFPPK